LHNYNDKSETRTHYLKHTKGFVNVPSLYHRHLNEILKSDKFFLSVSFDFNCDFLIATSPLAINFCHQVNVIQVIHDIIPLQLPSMHTGDGVTEFSKRIQYAVNAKYVWFVSKSTKIAVDSLGFDCSKRLQSNVVYQPISCVINKDLSYDFDLIANKYFVAIGSVEKRKNFHIIVDAFLKSEKFYNGYKLVIVGKLKNDLYSHDLLRLSKGNNQIICTNYIEDEVRDRLLKGAVGFLCPSILEGYGIPLIDAIQLGKKIICSDIPVFKELLEGNRATFIGVHDFAGWIKAINDIDRLDFSIPQSKFTFASFCSSIDEILTSYESFRG